MRVLVADQDSEALEAVARVFEVDIAMTKATCIDLLRANEYDVLIAAERLEDGSGLELLSQVAKRWPDVVRILAIEPSRRAMLKGKLAPFKLFDAIPYPMQEDHLQGVLERAADFCEPDEEEAPEQPPAPPPRAAAAASRPTRSLPPYSSALARTVVTSARAGSAAPSRAAAPSAGSASHRGRPTAPTGAPAGRRAPANPDSPPPLPSRASMRSYVPLGAPEQEVRIVQHDYSGTDDPLVSRVQRVQERSEAAQPSKAASIAAAVSAAVSRYMKPEPPPPPPAPTRRKPTR